MARKLSKINNPLTKVLKKLEKNSLLKSKFTLYAVFLVTLTVVLSYIFKSDWNSLGVLIAVGLLTNFFTKNMVITLGTAVIVSFLIRKHVLKIEGFKEGEEETEEETKEGMETEEFKEDMSGDLKTCWKYNKKTKKFVSKGKKKNTECAEPMYCWDDDSSNCKKPKSGFANKSIPSSKPAKVDGNDDDDSEGNRIDYSTTLEQAYDNLQNMLGTEGIKGLTSETSKLINQQKNLMDSIKGMGPMMGQAKEMMASLQGMTGGMGGMGDMKKNLASLKKMTNKN
jgi:hypothetical protein